LTAKSPTVDSAGSTPPSPNPAEAKSFAAFNPTTQTLKSASTSNVGSDHSGNVFAALDPTVRPGTASPASIRRSGSDRSGVSGGRVSSRHSERYGSNGRPRGIAEVDSEGDSTQLQNTLNKVSSAFSTGKQPLLPPSLPPSAAKQYMAGQNAENKGKVETDCAEPESEGVSVGGPLSTRGSVKDRTKMFHNTPIMTERPLSGMGHHKSSFKNTIQVEQPDKPEHVPSFKPPPPPTALKPKPARKNQELAQAINSAAAKKSQQDKDNVTHL